METTASINIVSGVHRKKISKPNYWLINISQIHYFKNQALNILKGEKKENIFLNGFAILARRLRQKSHIKRVIGFVIFHFK